MPQCSCSRAQCMRRKRTGHSQRDVTQPLCASSRCATRCALFHPLYATRWHVPTIARSLSFAQALDRLVTNHMLSTGEQVDGKTKRSSVKPQEGSQKAMRLLMSGPFVSAARFAARPRAKTFWGKRGVDAGRRLPCGAWCISTQTTLAPLGSRECGVRVP